MWAHILNAGLGVWLMIAPAIITSYTDTASANNRVFGPLVVAIGVVAAWEITRSARFANTAIGVWLLAACLLMGYQDMALISNLVTGIAVIGLSLVHGEHRPQRFGGGWIALWNEAIWNREQIE